MLVLNSGKELLGRYVIDKIVGSGGFGDVWKALDRQLSRNVALKRLLKQGSIHVDGQALKSMLEEAKKNALVVHPNVVQVYDIIAVDGEYLIVMEFVDGDSLHAYLRKVALSGQGIPLEQAIDWLHEILEGVAYAHGQRVCHRDLSPMNILLSSGGVPKISDFGIARIIPIKDDADPTPPQSEHGGTGNPEYMAPEQARGESADFLSDLFMVGICGYLLLTSRHPFAHPSGLFSVSELLKDDAYQPTLPVPPETLGISEQRRYREYAAIVMRLLSRDRAGRYQNAQEAIDTIDRVVPSVDCQSCGERVPEHFRFCGHCGAALTAAVTPPQHPPTLTPPKVESAEELVEQGFQLSLAKRWPEAIDAYKRAISVSPDYRKAFWNLGFAYNRIGSYSEALETLSKGLALPPSSRDFRGGMHYESSIALANLKRYDDALAAINESLRLNPDSVRSLFFRARVNLLRDDLDAAVTDARVVLRLNPDHSAALRMIDQITKARGLRSA